MKIAGAVSGLNRRQCTLPRDGGPPIVLTVQALPAGFEDEVNRLLPDPIPPERGYEVDAGTGRPKKDDRGRLLMRRDLFDPKPREAARLNNRRQFALWIAKALEVDTNVEFETTADRLKQPAEYADGIWAELEAFGLSTGDVLLLIREIGLVSNLDEERLAGAREAFLPEPPGGDESSTSRATPDEQPRYLIYRACERFGLAPGAFAGLSADEQLMMLAYEQIREHEEALTIGCPLLGEPKGG